MFLYEQIETLRQYGSVADMPAYIPANMNPEFELRPYQIMAFENFVTYFENDKMCRKPTQTLFHMATGSGKTLIMAGLMLYLYQKGYRNFLFFVNLSNIVNKTKENFLNPASSKYLFSEEIWINGERVPVREVENFQNTDENAINICFTTTQKLHVDMRFGGTKENAVSLDDFEDKKVVLIADEAHHLNVDLKHSSEDRENHENWEYTVKSIFEKNRDNVLLEFTATCDLENTEIRREYENKIILNYSLAKFREDGYSKEIKTLRSDLDVKDRALQALILSQYRYKVFQANKQSVKPVVFFKSQYVKENANNMEQIIEMVHSLTGEQIRAIFEQSEAEIMLEAKQYFADTGISFDDLATEIRDDFSEEHCISANDDKDVETKQIMLNSLEDLSNPYRAVFAVDKLNEGWDVLNLFDIVRLYETRDSKNGVPGKTTIKEAQLIGRGARYCPFKIESEQNKFKRKYDLDTENPLRVCEVMYYHCWNEPRYISELHTALRGIGLDADVEEVHYILKEDFKADPLYKEGYVFINDRVVKSRAKVGGLLPSIRDNTYSVKLETGQSGEDVIMEEGASIDYASKPCVTQKTIAEIADLNYAIVHKAICQYPILKFNNLKRYFPNLKSTNEFIKDKKYLGGIKIEITSKYDNPSPTLMYKACLKVLGIVADSISKTDDYYEGTKEFRPEHINKVFKDKKCIYTDMPRGGRGISQNDINVGSALRIDLSKEKWYAFEDNFGTSEEKAFVKYFKKYVPELEKKYDKVYLLRNERQFHIYSFDGGERFEPDYVIFLQSNKADGYEQLQVFVEPKGSIYTAKDQWKEDFLITIKDEAIPTKVLADDNDYKIWGFHFYNSVNHSNEFDDDFKTLIEEEEVTYDDANLEELYGKVADVKGSSN